MGAASLRTRMPVAAVVGEPDPVVRVILARMLAKGITPVMGGWAVLQTELSSRLLRVVTEVLAARPVRRPVGMGKLPVAVAVAVATAPAEEAMAPMALSS